MITVEQGNTAQRPIELEIPLTREILKQALIEEFRAQNIAVDVELDNFKIGRGIASIVSVSEPCVVVYNKQYRKKYHSLVLEMKQSYGRSRLYVHFGGLSKNSMHVNMSKDYYSIGDDDVYHYRPGLLGHMIGNHAKRGLQEEELYYDAAFQVIGAALVRATDMTERGAGRSRTSACSAPSYTAPSRKEPPAPKAAPTQVRPATKAASSAVPTAPKNIPAVAPPPRSASRDNVPRNTAITVLGEQSFFTQTVVKGRYMNLDALRQYHPQIYSALIVNPIFLANQGPTHNDFNRMSSYLWQYVQQNNLEGLLHVPYPASPITEGTNLKAPANAQVLFYCNPVFVGNSYFIAADILGVKKSKREIAVTRLEEIRSVSREGANIFVNGESLRNSIVNIELQYHILVYAVGVLLSMKYPNT